MPPQAQQGHRSSSGAVAGIDIITPSTRHDDDDTVKRMVLRRFRRTMRRLFGGRWKQMSDGEVRELEKKIAADMRTGTFGPVAPTIRPPPTGDELWHRQDDAGPSGTGPGRLPSMASTIKRSTVVSRAARGQFYDEYGDDYGGYQDAHSMWGGGGGAASSDSGYGPGYYDRAPPRKPLAKPALQPEYYVPGGGPFDMPEARPESVYDGGGGGSRANSMRSNYTTRTAHSRRPPMPPMPQHGYYPPNSSSYGGGGGGEGRAYSMRSDPGRIYARSPMPRASLRPQPSWDGRHQGGAEGPRSYSYGPGDRGNYSYNGHGDRGYAYGGENGGYRGWDGQDIEEHEYPPQDQYPPQDHYPNQVPGIHYQDYQYPER
ncbi:hypothetical protein KVR01_003489 [Diaporthe batatas]|uniref:uncharacterized protein n=1 Tax=Diaporthe batatas TaxID=748121 RepID=UPI001D04CE23|nr:uncharacterized protein KVR01_003489 [Diaporthe batatas]KAG8167800.1 hypothetical protein KVR01_003489 [Diaporthe batatas]